MNKKIRKKIKKFKLPRNKPVMIENADKKFHEKWSPSRHKLNIPSPWRCVACGPPNSGKTFWAYQLLLFQGCDLRKGENNPYEKVLVVHCSKHTKEYDMIGAEILEEIPAPNTFDGEKKTLVILEDLALMGLSKQQNNALSRLFAFCSTHARVDVFLTIQDWHSCPPIVRRCANLFILFPSIDNTSLQMISKKVGMEKNDLRFLFNKYCKKKYDNIWIDNSAGGTSPFKLRLNGFDIIQKNTDASIVQRHN